MSQIDKLKVLLARVEQRRHEPRLVAVSNASAQPSANTNVGAQAPVARSPQLELAPKPASQESFASIAPSSMPPPPTPLPPPPARISSLPPMTRTPLPPPPSGGPSSSVPPASPAPSEPLARTITEVLPAAPVRIAPTPVTSTEAPVRATSTPRIETPKTFGELLEQSLALRPKSG